MGATGNGGAASHGPGEEELLAALREGDEAAYKRVIVEMGGRLLAVARRILGNEEDARDTLQDALLQAFRNINDFKGQSLLSTWLHRIVVNVALMKLRSRRRKPEESIEPMLPVFQDDGHHVKPIVDWGENAEKMLQRQETRTIVREAIDRLPENYRTVMMLRDIEELSTNEAAEALGISPNAVKIRLHRARQALRQLIDPHARELMTR